MRPRNTNRSWITCILCFGLVAAGRITARDIPIVSSPTIASLSVQGTNLVVQASVPAGFSELSLEMRPGLERAWQTIETRPVDAAGSEVTFIMAKPSEVMEIFRLRGKTATAANAEVSADVPYVTGASLAANPSEAVFHFKGVIDGSDRILITRDGASWEHVNWSWPEDFVTVNGAKWNPGAKNFLTTRDPAGFLPPHFAFESAELQVVTGRDLVAIERVDQGLMIYLDDTQWGSSEYEFEVRFHRGSSAPAKGGKHPQTRLKIAATIDGSDTFKITRDTAAWTHQAHANPSSVLINGVSWDLVQDQELKNSDATRFLPADVDFSSARVVSRKGRDVATAWGEKDALWVRFADNPNGSDDYEIEIQLGN